MPVRENTEEAVRTLFASSSDVTPGSPTHHSFNQIIVWQQSRASLYSYPSIPALSHLRTASKSESSPAIFPIPVPLRSVVLDAGSTNVAEQLRQLIPAFQVPP